MVSDHSRPFAGLQAEICHSLHTKQFDSFNQVPSKGISSNPLRPFRGITPVLATNLKM